MNLEERKVVALEKIAEELERSNNLKKSRVSRHLENVAEEIEKFEPAVARLIRQYI